MNVTGATDQQLLARYAQDRAEAAFAELVRRHVNLAYSTALRLVHSPQTAEEITQSAFVDLAQSAARLQPDTILAAWLHQVVWRTGVEVIRRETRRRLREQIATEMNAINSPDACWAQVEPLLDEALSALDDPDRAAVLLRYFENKPLREVGTALGVSDDAAQKRVSRAVERLREYFGKHGVTVGTGGLTLAISANAVSTAPVTLAATITTAAIAGTAATVTVATAATKAIVMTTLQKIAATATIAVLAGTGIYEARQAANLRAQLQATEQRQIDLADQNQKLQSEQAKATEEIGRLRAANLASDSDSNKMELLRLRGEVGQLRQQLQNLATVTAAATNNAPPPIRQPLDLSQFPDSYKLVDKYSATNVGIATPTALLETWIYGLETADSNALDLAWEYPAGKEADKQQAIQAQPRMVDVFANHPADQFQTYRLMDLLPIEDEKYLALISETTPVGRKSVMKQIFHQVGNKWTLLNGPEYDRYVRHSNERPGG
ncbi:MAG TPA: sigma-70 family RNA polymerase sigma factor [Dongiaceae bacterium]|nr:sigma-70 family RNA polymerase sigma factor [Dongiaceae bacterium]